MLPRLKRWIISVLTGNVIFEMRFVVIVQIGGNIIVRTRIISD